ncbi:MAG TPA: pentapeptide repeat-containing protein [Actinocrinis sp.]|nr:pentapeptide repeat-containing protein [Actinocrinis sp.]
MPTGTHDDAPGGPDHPGEQADAAPGAADRALRADCENCFALCCVALWLTASADFALTKPAGTPCRNLHADNRCGIHARLRTSGFGGCATYDCFGAGQHVSQVTFGGRDWRTDPETAAQMFDVFPTVRALNELRWYLTEALALPTSGPVREQLRTALARTEQLTESTPAQLQALDVAAHRDDVNALLVRAGDLARAAVRGPRADHRGADLIGARLAGADLRAASLRGALMIGADLRRADLTGADLTGATLNGARLGAADLGGSLFLTQAQVDSAQGDAATVLPATLSRPGHWAESAAAAASSDGGGGGGRGDGARGARSGRGRSGAAGTPGKRR